MKLIANRSIRGVFLSLLLVGPAASAPGQSPKDQPAGLRESWDAIYAGESKVGHMRLWIEPVQDSQGRDLRRVRIDWDLTFQRGRDRSRIQQQYGTIEMPDGQVLRLDTLTKSSDQNIRTFGDVIDGKMTLTLEVGRNRTEKQIDWPDDVRGPYGAELSLSREPMQPGQTRSVKTYIPDLNKVCLTTMKAGEVEEITLGPKAEKHRLLRVEQVVTDDGGKALGIPQATLWVDQSGQIMKSFTDAAGGLYTYRTTKQGALTEVRQPLNLLAASIIKPPQPIPNPEATRSITYRIKAADAINLFPNDQRQKSQAESQGLIRLVVTADSPTVGAAQPDQPDGTFLRANPLIDCNDPLVLKHMRAAVGNRRDPWDKAVAIVEWVHANMKNKNFQVAFAPAGQVAKDLSGDCTEHGVLTAAMCRAAGIPTRCVIGLVYAPREGGFGPHMWNEVHVNNRWVAIDSAFKQSQVDATHIKMLDTSLDGVSPFEAFLPVLQLFNNVKIEPIEIRR